MGRHPVVRAVEAAGSCLVSVAELDPVFMDTGSKAVVLAMLVRLESQAAELRLRVMAAAGDVAGAQGDRDVASWLARETRMRRADAAADLRLAQALGEDYTGLATAVRTGGVTVAQARVIVAALDEISRERVTSEVIARAEQHLVREADKFGPTELRRLGAKILEVVDPEMAEAEEGRRLAESEKHAAEKQRLRMQACGDGLTRITGLVPDHVAVRLATYLHAFTNPRLQKATGETGFGEMGQSDGVRRYGGPLARLAHPKRLAQAFGQLLEVMDPGRLPVHGGQATTMVVRIDLEDLKQDFGSAMISNGLPGDGAVSITAGQARRLACSAHLVPAVLGGASEVLDVGRAQRLFTRAQRTALLLRDETCRADGCDVPGVWAEAHHLVPWSRGGPTDLANGILLCGHHHRRAHDAAYDMWRLPNGDVRYCRRVGAPEGRARAAAVTADAAA